MRGDSVPSDSPVDDPTDQESDTDRGDDSDQESDTDQDGDADADALALGISPKRALVSLAFLGALLARRHRENAA